MKKYHFRFLFVNPTFDPELANQNGGEETEDNFRFFWEDEIAVPCDGEIIEKENEPYVLRGQKGKKHFSHHIEGMHQFLLPYEGQHIVIAVSGGIIHQIDRELEGETPVISIQMATLQEPINPIPGVYISGFDIPEELDPTEKE